MPFGADLATLAQELRLSDVVSSALGTLCDVLGPVVRVFFGRYEAADVDHLQGMSVCRAHGMIRESTRKSAN